MSSPFFNEDHESIREMARDFAAKTLAPIAAEAGIEIVNKALQLFGGYGYSRE